MFIILWTITLCYHAMIAMKSEPCQFDTKCKCGFMSKHKLYKADCSGQRLKNVPSFPTDIGVIKLSNNDLKNIPDGHFQYNGLLQELNISQNKLKSLKKDTFQGLTNVTTLALHNNEINNISRDVFFYLNQLEYLDLKNNHINISNMDFTYLPLLKTLRMDLVGNGGIVFPDGLVSLIQADWSGLSGKCDVTILTPESFKSLPSLEDINLSACKINRMYKGTFSFMANLTSLDISYNTCLKFNGAANISSDLPNTSIQILKLNKIHKTFELNTEIQISHFVNLKETNLTEIHVESNRIQLIEKGALSMLPPTFRRVFMSDNEFSYGDYLFEIIFLPIVYADISNLFKDHTDTTPEEICHYKNRDDFGENSLIHHRNGPSISNNGIVVPLPYMLKTFLYRKCNLHYEIPPSKLSDNTLEYLDWSNNLLNPWTGPMQWLYSAKHLDLSNNLCSNVSTVFFKCCPNLKRLFIQNNLLGFVLPSDIDGEILQYLTKLEELNLSDNRIPTLPEKFFKSQNMLKRLHLGGNMLDDINFRMEHMTLLEYLDLSRNRLTSLTIYAQNQLDSVFRSSRTLTIDLSGNLLTCTCDTRTFVSWLAKTPIKLRKLSSYTCKLKADIRESMQNLTHIYDDLNKECSSYTALIIGTTATIVLFLFFLITGLIYRNRWKLRYMFYMVKIQYQRKGKAVDKVDKLLYEYDVFVSYDQNDKAFVHGKVLTALENETGLKLCLHQRDFLPGKEIAENITGAIHSSRKMLVVMSRSYLDSYWCMFEFNMAKIESLYSREKENIMFLVFLEQMPTKDLPLVVLELVQGQSYIEYPNDEFGDTVFWNKLKEVLQ